MTKYGLTEERHQEMLQEQEHKCLICGKEKKLYVDHDHATGKVRGLLCNRCNIGLCVLEEPDRLAASQAYLARH